MKNKKGSTGEGPRPGAHGGGVCPECGAELPGGRSCQALFDEFLALELTDPTYGAVHLLTVACFMVQHGRYSDQGLAWMAERLREYLEEGVPVGQIRRKAAGETRQTVRNWPVLRRPQDPPQARIRWSLTIQDAAGGVEDAARYRELVTQWARAVLREMQPLLKPADRHTHQTDLPAPRGDKSPLDKTTPDESGFFGPRDGF